MTNSTIQSFIRAFAFILCCSSCSEESQEKISHTEKFSTLEKPTFTILILGDSLTEGYGVKPQETYPFILQDRLNLEIGIITNTNYEVINGGSTGSTSSGGVSRIQWFLKAKPDYMILALGGNDGLRGIPTHETRKNLAKILSKANEKNIPTMLAGMKIPPNYGLEYTREFENIFPSLADEYKIPLIPFLLDGVGGNPNFNLPDRIHPNPEGHRKIADLVFSHLSSELKNFSLTP